MDWVRISLASPACGIGFQIPSRRLRSPGAQLSCKALSRGEGLRTSFRRPRAKVVPSFGKPGLFHPPHGNRRLPCPYDPAFTPAVFPCKAMTSAEICPDAAATIARAARPDRLKLWDRHSPAALLGAGNRNGFGLTLSFRRPSSVPIPTFTLCQPLRGGRLPLDHWDLCQRQNRYPIGTRLAGPTASSPRALVAVR